MSRFSDFFIQTKYKLCRSTIYRANFSEYASFIRICFKLMEIWDSKCAKDMYAGAWNLASPINSARKICFLGWFLAYKLLILRDIVEDVQSVAWWSHTEICLLHFRNCSLWIMVNPQMTTARSCHGWATFLRTQSVKIFFCISAVLVGVFTEWPLLTGQLKRELVAVRPVYLANL